MLPQRKTPLRNGGHVPAAVPLPTIDRAFELAYFLHPEKATALEIATAALEKLEVASAAQDKRLYYLPTGRHLQRPAKAEEFRTKVSLSELPLLQRLIYIESEPYERRKEKEGVDVLLEEDLLVHFIKHLVQITVKRNSFYLTLGISRLLHSYSTCEAMEIYSVLVEDPEHSKEDYYYRSRKGLLLHELKERFDGFLHLVHGAHGEEKLQARESPGKLGGLVRECLNRFTPWTTPCLVPSRSQHFLDGAILRLSFAGQPQAGGHEIEMNRMHAILHPDCFRRLAELLRLQPPERRLALPHFLLSGDWNSPRDSGGGDRRNPPKLAEEDRKAVESRLAEQASRRRRAWAGLLRVFVDGSERALWDVSRSTRLRLEVEREAELIEIRGGKQEEVLLAAHLLGHEENATAGSPSKRAIVLEGGQKLEFTIRREVPTSGALVEITYQETSPFRLSLLLLRRLTSRLRESGRLSIRRPALPLAVLAFCAGLTLYILWREPAPEERLKPALPAELQRRDRDSSPPRIPAAGESSTDSREAPTVPRRGPVSAAGSAGESPGVKLHGAPNSPRDASVRIDKDADRIRGLGLEPPSRARSLLEIKSISLKVSGKVLLSELEETLARAIERTGRFTIVKSGEEADALLKAVLLEPDRIHATLINAEGQVIWRGKGRAPGGTYRGSLAEAAKAIVHDLVSEIERRQPAR